ncbi:MAG: phosphopantothenoylcysteine decarboxylase [Lentisphaeria bacterium]|nr:phosphopantothenoylcysteine decarboxylase [Lentisphaeria bacterium]
MTGDGKKLIVLGVTGGIAAYKAADLCSKLAKVYEVQVIMTENAQKFVTPLTFQTLSRRPVITSLWETAEWRPRHVELADEADCFVCAPATANFLAKYAHGIADDALTTFCATYHGLSVVAPAMNPKMWSQTACMENVNTLKLRGVQFAGPACGHVACGADGAGRMMEAAEIFDILSRML